MRQRKSMGVFLLAMLTLATGGAVAQTTTCGEEIGKWVCRTQQGPLPPDYFRQGQEAFDRTTAQMQAIRAQQEARAAARQQAEADLEDQHHRAAVQARADEAQGVRKVIGAAIQHGECAYAKELALKEGDFDLAEQVQRLCKPN